MKLSIITTVYQAEKDLPRLLDSMMEQKSPELEFFLIDNGCTDGSAAICKEYAQRDTRFRIYALKENIGYIRARNLGLEVIDADYVGFCDSDDYLMAGAYDKVIDCLKDKNPDLYIGNWNTISENGDISGNSLPMVSRTYDTSEDIQEIAPHFYGPTPKGSMLHGFMWKQVFRLSLIRSAVIHFKESLKPWEDMLFNAQFLNRCKKVTVDGSNVIYNYVVSANSITGMIQTNVDIEGECQRIMILSDDLKNIAPDDDCKIANANRSLRNIITLVSQVSRGMCNTPVKRLTKAISQSYISEIISKSAPWTLEYKLLKPLVRYRMFGVMLFVFKHFRQH